MKRVICWIKGCDFSPGEPVVCLRCGSMGFEPRWWSEGGVVGALRRAIRNVKPNRCERCGRWFWRGFPPELRPRRLRTSCSRECFEADIPF